jgi:hypothetical protein
MMPEVNEALDEILEDMKVLNDSDFMKRRMDHINFQKTVFFLCVQSQKVNSVESKDLRKFMGCSQQWANYVMNDLDSVGFLKKIKKGGNKVFYVYMRHDDGRVKLMDYFEEARDKLGIKIKFEMKKEVINR